MLNFCDGFDIKLEPYLERQYIKLIVYKIYRNSLKFLNLKVVNWKLPFLCYNNSGWKTSNL